VDTPLAAGEGPISPPNRSLEILELVVVEERCIAMYETPPPDLKSKPSMSLLVIRGIFILALLLLVSCLAYAIILVWQFGNGDPIHASILVLLASMNLRI
jgi:hypothetical protein